MAAHSKYSASGFEATMLCPGKTSMERGLPDTSSKYADEGTAAHTVLSWGIEAAEPPRNFTGARIAVGLSTWEVTTEMASAVQTALDNIASITAGGVVLSEQRVNYSVDLGVPEDEGWGTSDVIAVLEDKAELQVHDYKHGMGVQVSAGYDEPRPEGEPSASYCNPNPQMALYALGALNAVSDLFGPFETVRLVIHQPRITGVADEYVITVADLRAWALDIARPAVVDRQIAEANFLSHVANWSAVYLRPSIKACKFCKAKATCPALRSEVETTVGASESASPDEFLSDIQPSGTGPWEDKRWLAACLNKADLIEDWLKAVRAEVERRLLASKDVPGYKLVRGKQGNRAWADAAAAEAALKAMRLKVEQMYNLSLISPTSAEKLAPALDKEGKPKPLKEGQEPPAIGPRQWKSLQSLIVRAEGKAHVAPASDPRPALVLTPAADDFTNEFV